MNFKCFCQMFFEKSNHIQNAPIKVDFPKSPGHDPPKEILKAPKIWAFIDLIQLHMVFET